jgi:type I restriction enzyme S subunit
MTKGWQTKTLDQISTNLDSRRVPITKGVRVGGGYPYYGASGIVDYVADYIFDEDTLLISEDGANLLARSTPIAFPAFGKYWVNNHAHILKFENLTTQRFVELYLESIPLDAYVTGAAQPKLNQKALNSIPIPVPPLAEQRRIVAILDEAFDAIATAKANAEKNLQNARALFERHLQSVFTKRGKEWVARALGDVCGFVRGPFGGSLKKSIFVADGYAVYEQQHAIYDQFDDVRYFIDEAKFKEMKRFELLPNDLIMSCSGTMGRVAIAREDIKRGIINQALLKLTPSTEILNAFLKSWMESEAFQDALKEYSGGAAIQNVASVRALKEIRIPLPSVKEQTRVVDELDVLRKETQLLASLYQRKLVALEALKKSLLHQAFTGGL